MRRMGGVTQGLLITLGVLGALTTTAVVVGPRYLNAGPHRPPLPDLIEARQSEHQAFINDLATLVSTCVGVLAVHPRGSTPFEETVLWLTDDDPQGKRGRPDQAELAVLSHSTVMQTITIYRRNGPGDGAASLMSSVHEPSFCDAWRADPDVVPVVIQWGVSDMHIERVGQAREEWGAWGAYGGLQRLLIRLTWPSGSNDPADSDKASAVVDTVLFSDTSEAPIG